MAVPLASILKDHKHAVLGVATVITLALAGSLGFRIFQGQQVSHAVLTVAVPSRADGFRYRFAARIAQEAATDGLTLTLKSVDGSDAALAALETGAADLAFVQGGLEVVDGSDAREIAPLYIEPLHLLVRGELRDAVADDLGALRGHVVNFSGSRSGTHALASDLAAFAGLSGIEVQLRDPTELLAVEDAKALPDAMFLVDTMPSPVVDRFIRTFGYRLVPLPFWQTYTLDRIDADASGRIDRLHVFETEIPAFAYGIAAKEPPVAYKTLGTRLLLVGREEVPAPVVAKLLEVLFRPTVAALTAPPLTPAVLDLPPERETHAGTAAYVESTKPVQLTDVATFFENLAHYGGLALGIYLFLKKWYDKLKGAKRMERLEDYVQRVGDIEKQAEQARAEDPAVRQRSLVKLQSSLHGLKSDVIEAYVEGRLESTDMLASFLVHLNDARLHLGSIESSDAAAEPELRSAG